MAKEFRVVQCGGTPRGARHEAVVPENLGRPADPVRTPEEIAAGAERIKNAVVAPGPVAPPPTLEEFMKNLQAHREHRRDLARARRDAAMPASERDRILLEQMSAPPVGTANASFKRGGQTPDANEVASPCLTAQILIDRVIGNNVRRDQETSKK